MAVSLSKGGNVSLSKEAPGLTAINVGLGWDARVTDGSAFDLDASAFLCNEGGKVRSDADFIFYNNKTSSDGSVVHQGDNLTGAGDGDDEAIKVDLSKLPATVKSLVFTVNSFRGQTFETVANATCRVVDEVAGKELARFTLSESGSHTGLVMAKIYRHNGEWKLHAIGDKTNGRTFHDMMPAITAAL